MGASKGGAGMSKHRKSGHSPMSSAAKQQMAREDNALRSSKKKPKPPMVSSVAEAFKQK